MHLLFVAALGVALVVMELGKWTNWSTGFLTLGLDLPTGPESETRPAPSV